MSKSASYHPCDCGGDCYKLDLNPDETCWGWCSAEDEVWDEEAGDSYWRHVCQGHNDDWPRYKPEPA